MARPRVGRKKKKREKKKKEEKRGPLSEGGQREERGQKGEQRGRWERDKETQERKSLKREGKMTLCTKKIRQNWSAVTHIQTQNHNTFMLSSMYL